MSGDRHKGGIIARFPMKRNIRYFIQKLIVILSFPPLTYLFQKIYSLSITVAVRLLKRRAGVAAIYLRRGVAKKEIVYGLSDIDLLVITDDQNEQQPQNWAKGEVMSAYNRLRHFIPLFGEADRELGVYSISEFFQLYADNDSFKYRFNEGKYTWKLLFGKDLVKDLPELPDKELYLPATEELRIWWPLLNTEFGSECVYPQFQRKYLWYKAISEASKVYLFICHGERVHDREVALAKVREYLTYEQNCYIDKIQCYLKNLTSKEDLILDDLMGLFIELSAKAFDEMERKLYGDSKGKTAILNNLDYHDLIVDSNVLNLIEKLEMHVKREIEPYLDYVALIPQVEFGMDVLYNSDIDSFHVVLVQRGFMPVEKLKGVNLLFEENPSPQSIEPFIMHGNIALSLKAESWYQCIKSPKQCPLFFALVSHVPLTLFKKWDETQSRSIQSDLPPNTFEETIKKRIAKIDTTISNKNIYKMKNLDFLRFFWGAARTKLLAYSIESDEIHIPVTSKQINEMLVQFFPENSDWLNDLYGEYKKELLGNESDAYRLFTKSIDFLKRI